MGLVNLKLGAWGAWFAKLGMFLGVAILTEGLTILLCIAYIKIISY